MAKNFEPSSLEELLPWLNLYAQALAGQMFPGYLHNLNNPLHLLKMQTSLVLQKLDTTTSAKDLKKHLQQLQLPEKKINELVQIIQYRENFNSLEKQPLDLNSFLNWLEAYWQNNLLFKHNVELKVENKVLNFTTIPLLLNFSLEQALLNALEELEKEPKQVQFFLTIEKETPFLKIILTTPTLLEVENAFEPFITSKKNHLGLGLTLVQKLLSLFQGKAEILSQENTTTLTLFIPQV